MGVGFDGAGNFGTLIELFFLIYTPVLKKKRIQGNSYNTNKQTNKQTKTKKGLIMLLPRIPVSGCFASIDFGCIGTVNVLRLFLTVLWLGLQCVILFSLSMCYGESALKSCLKIKGEVGAVKLVKALQ